MTDRIKFAYLTYDDMLSKIDSGDLNEYDIIYSKDQYVTYLITEELKPLQLRSRVYVFDSVSEAEIKLNKHEKQIDAEYWGTSENKEKNISEYEKESNRLKSRNRAKNKILRLVRANDDMCTFITLTFTLT